MSAVTTSDRSPHHAPRLARLFGALLATAVTAGYGASAAVDVLQRSAATPRDAPSASAQSNSADRTQSYLQEVEASPSLPPPSSAAGAPLTAVLTGIGGPRVVVPILLYHYVRVVNGAVDKVGFGLSVTPNNFAAQMRLLSDVGAHPVTIGEVMAAMTGGPPLPPRAVVLTFDDGYADFATTAVPIMRQYGFRATNFVVSGFIGRPNYMSSGQILDVMAAGMVIGAHTVDHIALAHTSLVTARNEINVSRQALQQLTGTGVDDFAYPYGDYNYSVAQLVKDAGFRDAVTTDGGAVQYLALRFELRRIRVGGYDTLASFAFKAGVPASSGGGASQPPRPLVSPSASSTTQPTPQPTPEPTPQPASSPTPLPDPTPSPTSPAAQSPPTVTTRTSAADRRT